MTEKEEMMAMMMMIIKIIIRVTGGYEALAPQCPVAVCDSLEPHPLPA